MKKLINISQVREISQDWANWKRYEVIIMHFAVLP